jgi:hypothetical protein
MKITGIQIREAVKHWTAQKLLLSKVFVDSGFSFPNENKQTPEEVAAQFEQASRCVAELESLQQAYNGAHSFVLEGRMLTLSEGVKLMAAYAQLVNMWTTIRAMVCGEQRRTSWPFAAERPRKLTRWRLCIRKRLPGCAMRWLWPTHRHGTSLMKSFRCSLA